MSKTYIGISRDHSISMRSIARAAARDYNQTIEGIREASTSSNQDTILYVVRCGDFTESSGGVLREVKNSSVNAVRSLNESAYGANGPSTPLFDSVGDLIEQLEQTPDAKDPEVTFLVMAITDGDENSSRRWSAARLTAKINELQKTDRWTFVFRVPRGSARELSRRFGIPTGNILEWDQTERGVEVATQATKAAFTQYYGDLARGVKSTTKFYANLSEVDIKTVKAALVDVSSQVDLWLTSQKEVIKDFCERKSKKGFIKGAAFYQLTKRESEVQDYKQIVIRDKVSGAVYGGPAARDLLQLPKFGTIAVNPGDHGQYDIYIQSTSVNRVLPPGTQLLYWPTHADPISTPSTAAKAVAKVAKTVSPAVAPAKTVAPVAAKPAVNAAGHDADFQRGYSEGFEAGKVKSAVTTRTGTTSFRQGYIDGYKDGRGKKKRLYK